MKKLGMGIVFVLIAALLFGCGTGQRESWEQEETAAGETPASADEETETVNVGSDIYGIDVPADMPENEIVYQDTCYTYTDGELTSWWVYTYDEHDNLIREEKLDIETGEQESTGNYAYIYNEQGLTEVKYWGRPEHYEVFLYNELGLLMESIKVKDGSEYTHYYYEYDEHGNEISWIEVKEDEICFAEYQRYVYDDRENIRVLANYDQDRTLKFTMDIEYDAYDRVTKILNDFDGYEEYNNYNTYEYDERGNLIREDLFEMDSEEPYAYILYEYDSDNRCTREEHFSDGISHRLKLHEYEEIATGGIE